MASIDRSRDRGSDRAPEREQALEAFARAGGDTAEAEIAAVVGTLGEAAPALVPLVVSDPSIPARVLGLGLSDTLDVAAIRAHLTALSHERRSAGAPSDEAAIRSALRRGRQLHLVRIALREARGWADVDETAREMSALAAAATDLALEHASASITAQHGTPIVAGTGLPGRRTCLGMGKLGGLELNLGSDVDLCFFYETDDTDEPPGQKLSTHEIEGRIATRATKILADVDEEGFVFRVDLRLRPEGARGPVVGSLASAERYYESFGRSWERAVLLRARPIAGDVSLGLELLEAVRPFVFRRAVDPRIARDMAQMLERTRLELAVDDVQDVKLGRGGIREAEFFVQTLQLVWGGRHPELQVPGTLAALGRLVRLGLVSDREARDLEASWALLRRIEHRIHVWAGYQTHRLPSGPALEAFARSLAFPSGDALHAALASARSTVEALFRSLLEETSPGTNRAALLAERVASGAEPLAIEPLAIDVLHVDDGAEAAVHLLRLARHADDPLGPRSRERHPTFGPHLLECIAESAEPSWALRHAADFFARLRGWDYLQLIEERGALRRLMGLFGYSEALAAALVGHPEDLDVLLSSVVPTASDIVAAHASLLDPAAKGDPEALVGSMRAVKRQLSLRIGLTFASGELTLIDSLACLSALAIEQTKVAVALAEHEVIQRFGRPAASGEGTRASLVVVAMGKLGASELGWGSDLDLVFLYDRDGATEGPRSIEHVELFTRIAQRALRVLSQADREGPGYATDTRLRPSGSQGTLVSSFDALDRYREHAQGWERQAWVRAVPIVGEPRAMDEARALIARAAYHGPPPTGPELWQMKERIERELAHETEHAVHPKLGRGALMEIELCAQLLQLRTARTERALDPPMLERLRSPSIRRAIDALADAGALSAVEREVLRSAWMFFRAVEQALRMLEPAGDGRLHLRSRVADRVARRLNLRGRADAEAGEVLAQELARHRERVRAVFRRVTSDDASAG